MNPTPSSTRSRLIVAVIFIAILVAVVNFGSLASIEAGAGAAAFASVVILTMLAALTFDPRLIWDNTETDHD